VKVLVVDDNEDLRILIRAIIEPVDETIDVRVAESGADALDQWRTWSPDLIVLDQRMPDMTGLEVAELVLVEDPQQPIVLLTAHVSLDQRRHAQAIGVAGVIEKDMQLTKRLTETVGEIVARRAG
jgi:CheY-like chemotaxis protein